MWNLVVILVTALKITSLDLKIAEAHPTKGARTVESEHEHLKETNASRWQDLVKEIRRRAELVRLAREILRKKIEKGDQKEIRKAQTALKKAEEYWREIENQAKALEGRSYEEYLIRRRVKVETELEQARKEWEDKRDKYKKFLNASEELKNRNRNAMEGEAKEFLKATQEMGANSGLGLLKGLGRLAKQGHAFLSSGRAGEPSKGLERLAKVIDGFEITYNITKEKEDSKKYWESIAGILNMGAELLVKHPQVYSEKAAQQIAVYPFFLKMGFNVAEIAQTYYHFRQAENIFYSQLEMEEQWRWKIEYHGRQVAHLKLEKERVDEQINSHAHSKVQIELIKGEYSEVIP